MEKSLIALGLTFLTACNSVPVDGFGAMEGRVTFMDGDSVTFCTGLEMEDMDAVCPNDYVFGEDTIVKFYQNGELVMLPPAEAALQIMSSSNSDDYLFNFVLTGDTVLEMTQIEPAAEKVAAPQPFYIISLTMDGRMAGSYEMNTDPVEWLSSPGGCTMTASTGRQDLPLCNPNGFLVLNESTEDTAGYMIPETVSVYVHNLPALIGVEALDSEQGTLITFEQLVEAFEQYPEFFETTPFELEYGTGMVDGQERSDMILAIKEIYIP